jgi:hypothetical protein
MKEEIILELYKTREGRFSLLTEILKLDGFSISEIVNAKETAMNIELVEKNTLISGLAFRATSMFGEKVQDTLKAIEQVKPLVAKDILKSGVVKGTSFEKQLLEQYPN